MSTNTNEWIGQWASRCGVMLIVGFVVPFVISSPFGGGSQWFWFWNQLGNASFMEGISILLPLVLGIGALVIVTKLDGRERALALLGSCILVLLINMATGAGVQSSMAQMGPASPGTTAGGGLMAILALLSLVSIAVGNHLSKGTRQDYPRFMVGIGGAVLILVLVLPISGGSTLRMLITGQMWQYAWFLNLLLIAVLAYGGLGIAQFFQQNFGEMLSLSARGLLYGAPVLIFVGLLTSPLPIGFFSALLMIIKLVLLMYGLLLLLAASLSATLETVLEAPAEGAAE